MTQPYAYYNENDPLACAWLQELIRCGHIMDGAVDSRSIADVDASDLREISQFTQHHFFAGIGGWAYALKLAGWPDDQPVWTGSCPCQPFSIAGQRKGNSDVRHLWPDWYGLIRILKPAVVFGEQVAAAAGRDWLSAVRTDLEEVGYEVGAADLCAAGVGAPHLRQRLYWVGSRSRCGSLGLADGDCERRGQLGAAWLHERRSRESGAESVAQDADRARGHDADGCGKDGCGGLGDAGGERLEGLPRNVEDGRESRRHAEEQNGSAAAASDAWNPTGGVADMPRDGWGKERSHESRIGERDGSQRGASRLESGCNTYGAWSACDWLPCSDGKQRPVEPVHVKMVARLSRFMGYLRSDGNKAEQVQEVVNGPSKKANTVQTLPSVRVSDDAKVLRQNPRGSSGIQASEVLQPQLHGELHARSDQSANAGEQSKAVWKTGETCLREMPTGEDAAVRASYRSRPDEQRPVELADVVRLLPSSLSLAELHGDRDTVDVLCALSEAIRSAWPVRDSSDSIQEVWRSLAQESQSRIAVGFDASEWLLVIPQPLVKKPVNRVMRLRGYGNSIVPQLAAEFIKAAMDCLRIR